MVQQNADGFAMCCVVPRLEGRRERVQQEAVDAANTASGCVGERALMWPAHGKSLRGQLASAVQDLRPGM